MSTRLVRGSPRWVIIAFTAAILLGTMLAAASQGEVLRFVFMGDSRGDNVNLINTTALNEINAQIVALSPQPSFVIFGGDMATFGENADGSDNFQAFKNAMKTLTDAGIKLYVVLGNHELYQEPTKETEMYRDNQLKYQTAFADMPGNAPSDDYKRLVYSFTSPGGDCFFAVLDPYYMDQNTPQKPDDENGTIDPPQLTWLTDQIAGTTATHKFLFIHVPAYKTTATDTHTSYMELWTLLDNNKFDMYCCGHEHLYSRKSINSGVDPSNNWKNNVIQVINGGAGAPFNTDPIVRNPILWNVKENQYFFTVVDINGRYVRANTYGGISGNYSVVDSFSISPVIAPEIGLLSRWRGGP